MRQQAYRPHIHMYVYLNFMFNCHDLTDLDYSKKNILHTICKKIWTTVEDLWFVLNGRGQIPMLVAGTVIIINPCQAGSSTSYTYKTYASRYFRCRHDCYAYFEHNVLLQLCYKHTQIDYKCVIKIYFLFKQSYLKYLHNFFSYYT